MKDKAIDIIQDGIENGFAHIFDYLYSYLFLISNPYFDVLREEPRFIDIIRQAKITYEERLNKYSDY